MDLGMRSRAVDCDCYTRQTA